MSLWTSGSIFIGCLLSEDSSSWGKAVEAAKWKKEASGRRAAFVKHVSSPYLCCKLRKEVAKKVLFGAALAAARMVPATKKLRRGYRWPIGFPSMQQEIACRSCGKCLR